MIILGIDPGLTGGIGVLNGHGQLLHAYPMPIKARNDTKNEVDAAGLTRILTSLGTVIEMVVLERQRPMPSLRFGKKAQSPQVGFSLGMSQGIVVGVAAALGLPLTYAEPQTWKKFYGLKGGRENKPLARARAIELYPGAPLSRVKDEGVAEALLIARWWLMKDGIGLHP